jgi:hypothetical protein
MKESQVVLAWKADSKGCNFVFHEKFSITMFAGQNRLSRKLSLKVWYKEPRF